jgi:hypothetical protein
MENIFVVRPFTSTSLGWWHTERDQIDLSPPYQRKSGVWNLSDKAFLIDSIINGYDIPKFYIADFSYTGSALNQSGKPFAVIDGRQRFEAIFDFMDGKVPLNADMRYLSDPQIRLGKMKAHDLEREHPRIFQRINSFPLSVMSVITNEVDRINDLFVRLNKSKPLTGAEVRSAMSGEVPMLIRSIANTRFFSTHIGFSNQRKQHENVAAKLLLIEHRGGFVETKKTNLDRFVNEALRTESEFSQSAKAVKFNLQLMERMFPPTSPLLKSSGMLPVYYWLVRNNSDRSDLHLLLTKFASLRLKNQLHPAVARFNSVSRSTNDELSYRVRYGVLEDFCRNGGQFTGALSAAPWWNINHD